MDKLSAFKVYLDSIGFRLLDIKRSGVFIDYVVKIDDRLFNLPNVLAGLKKFGIYGIELNEGRDNVLVLTQADYNNEYDSYEQTSN